MDLFTKHPATVDESYLKHMWFATRCGVRLILAGTACVIHAFLPFLFVKTASSCVKDISERMITRK